VRRKGSDDRELAQRAHRKTGWIGVFGEVLTGKGMGGGRRPFCGRAVLMEKRGGSGGGPVRAAPRRGRLRGGALARSRHMEEDDVGGGGAGGRQGLRTVEAGTGR
jgi:hypothetical protein